MTSFALYEAYGIRPYEWGDDPDRQKANTKEEESDLGLLNEGMRFRDLETGVFLTRDPIGYGDGPNVYCYVHCNPITHFDAFGLETIEDYGGQLAQLEDDKQEQLDALEEEWADKDKNGQYNRDRNNINRSFTQQKNAVQDKINQITQTASSMNELTGNNIDPRSLNDDWSTYKDYRASDMFMNFTGTKDFADKATNGDIKGAAKEFAILEAKAIIGTMIGSKAFQMAKGSAVGVVGGLGDDAASVVAGSVDDIGNSVFHGTENGVILPKGVKIPSDLVQNPFGRVGSYGKFDSSVKFYQTLRVDAPTPPGMKGPNFSHFHVNDSGKHLTDLTKWPGGK